MKWNLLPAAIVFVFESVLTFDSPGQPVLTPSGPSITPSPVFVPGSPVLPLAPGSPGFTNANPTATAPTVPGLTMLLTNFQAQVEQLLPALSAFNDGFDFFTLGNGAGSATPGGTAATNASNSGLAFAAAAVAGPMATNGFGLPARVATMPAARDTLRALLILQNDLERLLPLVAALDGTTTNFTATNAVAPVFIPGAITNVFGAGGGF